MASSRDALDLGGGGGGRDGWGGEDSVVQSLREQVVFLERKLKYVQSVSTIFRQKIALIMREASRSQGGFGAFEGLHQRVLGEMAMAEQDPSMNTARWSAPPNVAGVAAVASSAAPMSPRSGGDAGARAQTRSDDVRKAHHLCQILQEKSEIKEREIELRRALAASEDRYTELYDRHTRLLNSAGSAQGAAAAHTELWERREAELHRQLVAAKAETLRALQQQTLDDTPTVYEDAVVSDATAQKQNRILRARAARLREELSEALAERGRAAQEQQEQLAAMAARVQAGRTEAEARDAAAKKVGVQLQAAVKDLAEARAAKESLERTVAELEASLVQGGAGGAAAAAEAAASTAAVESATAAAERAREDAAEQRRAAEALATELEACRTQLRSATFAAREKDILCASLAAQMDALRARIEASESAEAQRGLQREVFDDVGRRLMAAVDGLKDAQSTKAMSEQAARLGARLAKLEGIELQLRLKEDQLCVAQDAAAQATRAATELRRALTSISALFARLPRSVSQLERLVVELEEYRREVTKAAAERAPPDVVAITARVDLRLLEAKGQRAAARGGGRGASVGGGVGGVGGGVGRDGSRAPSAGGGGGVTPGPARAASSAALRPSVSRGDSEDEDDARFDALLSSLPPAPPPLVDLAAAAGIGRARSTSQAPTAAFASPVPGAPNAAPPPHQPQPPVPASDGGPSESDVRLTFQLFDETGNGMLSVETAQLCLSTLGLPPSLLGKRTRPLSLNDFLVCCMDF